MPELDEKIPSDFVPLLTRGERARQWFLPAGETHWLRRLRWERCAGACVLAGLLGYLTLATAIFGFARWGRGIDGVQWADIAWPPHWPRYRVARGEKFHAEAKRFHEQGLWREALMYARNAVALAPENRDGRLLLVTMLQAAHRPVAAREALLEGLRYHRGDADYLREVFKFLLRGQEDERVLMLARRGLEENPAASMETTMCALAGSTAAFYRGHYDEAEDLLTRAPGLAASRDGRLMRAKIEWERGFREGAVAELRRLVASLPHDADVHRELASDLRQLGLPDESRRVTMAFQIGHPDLPAPRVELLRAYREAGESRRMGLELDAYLRDFARDENALMAVGALAAELGDEGMALRLVAHVQAQELASEPYRLLVAEALIVSGRYEESLARVRDFSLPNADAEGHYETLLASLRAVAHFGMGDTASGQLFLDEFLSRKNLRAENLVIVANRLLRIDAAEAAKKTLRRACELDPRNQSALTRLVEIELGEGHCDELPDHVRELVAMRRPSSDVLRVAESRLGSDAYLFTPAADAALRVVRTTIDRLSTSGAFGR